MIFVDRSIPRAVARALQLVRDDVRWLEDIFAHNTPDTEWLEHCGKNGWIVLTRDRKIRHRPAEKEAIVRAGVGAFVITSGGTLTRWDLLRIVVYHLPEIERLHAVTPHPFIVRINSSGMTLDKP